MERGRGRDTSSSGSGWVSIQFSGWKDSEEYSRSSAYSSGPRYTATPPEPRVTTLTSMPNFTLTVVFPLLTATFCSEFSSGVNAAGAFLPSTEILDEARTVHDGMRM